MADKDTPRYRYVERWGALKTERATWLTHWKDLSQYLQPRAGRFFVTDRNRGWKRHQLIYDNTGIRAANTLAAGLMGGMTSPARPWMRLTLADRDLGDYAPVKRWLSAVTATTLSVFAQSNTYRALHTCYRELGIFGTAASIVASDYDDVIRHHTLTTGEYAIAHDDRGQVCTLYREIQRTVAQLVHEFGREACSPAVRTLYDRGALDSWVTIIHAIEPRSDRDPTKIDARNMAWRSIYFDPADDSTRILRESGFKKFPALVARWDLHGGDIYGSSPGMDALGDVIQLQHEQARKGQVIDKKTNPPLQAPTSLKGRERDMLPGGITFVDAVGPQNGIRTLHDVDLDLNHLLMDIQDVRERVRGAFYTDLFLMLSQASTPQMTATEVAERHEEKLLMLGPVLERLHNELLSPLIETTFERLTDAGALPPPPPELEGQSLDIEFVSILAQAQRAVQTNSVDRFVSNAMALAQVKPEVLDRFDADHWAEDYSDMLGVDPKYIVPRDDAEKVRAARAAATAQAQQAQQMQAAADTANKLANAPTGDNALASVMDQFTGYT